MIEWLAGAGLAAGLGFSARYNWWRGKLGGVPVLMYHHITDSLNGTRFAKLRVRPRDFAHQLDWLLDHGYETAPLAKALSASASEKKVVLSFDDGYRNFYDEAWPLLKQRGMIATVFLVSERLGGVNEWDREKGEPQEKLMSREQIKELAGAGIEFGGHGSNHIRLSGLEETALEQEVNGCQKTLTGLLGKPAEVFSYPFGLWDQAAARAVKRAGFEIACSTRPGMLTNTTPPFEVPRVIIKRKDDMLDFRLKLTRARSTF